jgi:hypothetical protein
MTAVLDSPAAAPATQQDASVCVLCGKAFSEFGNNPWPLATLDDGQCCDSCNGSKVLPARMARLVKAKA